MSRSRTSALALSLLALVGCTDTPNDDTDDTDDTTAVTSQEVTAPSGCKPVVAIARPIAAPHYHDPNLKQTAGKLTSRVGSGIRTGTILATLTGADPDGTQRGDHDLLFADAGFRTRGDLIQLAPTADPCLFDATTELYVTEGTGAYAQLTGTLHGAGTINFCGGAGKIVITGYVCAGGHP